MQPGGDEGIYDPFRCWPRQIANNLGYVAHVQRTGTNRARHLGSHVKVSVKVDTDIFD